MDERLRKRVRGIEQSRAMLRKGADMIRNTEGLTYTEWLGAAVRGVPAGRHPEELVLRAAWREGQDPTEVCAQLQRGEVVS